MKQGKAKTYRVWFEITFMSYQDVKAFDSDEAELHVAGRRLSAEELPEDIDKADVEVIAVASLKKRKNTVKWNHASADDRGSKKLKGSK